MTPTCDPFVTRFDPPLPAGEGPLAGLTVAVKDSFDIAGVVSGNGNPEWAASHPAPTADAPLVARLRALGLAVVGKTQMDELAFSLMGANARYGAPPNPAAPDRVPGGSSSGSASATAAGLCDIGLGSDTGGSVRMPASFCGLVGWRATHGALPVAGLAPLAPSFDAPGFFSRDLATMERLAAALFPQLDDAGPEPDMRAPAEFWAAAEPETAEALAPACTALTGDAGAVARAPLSDRPLQDWLQCFRTHQAFEVWRALGPWVSAHAPAFGPGVRERFAWAGTVSQEAFAAAAATRAELVAVVEAALGRAGDGAGVLVLPTAPGPAPLLTADGAALEAFRNAALAILSVAGLAGLPQITLPVATASGAPVGISLVGPRGADRRLMRLAGALTGR